jgi:wobble nucleotide-excising tRNase
LKTFLGRQELVFETESEGYSIKRNGKIAKNLSEGEKTAIAFVYFTVHLQDQEFDVKDGIIVIDDPISSLDSNSIFQAFAFLKNTVKDAKQVFIFTHNFDFIRLLINWLSYRSYEEKRSYYMLTERTNQQCDERSIQLEELDPLLKEHESEYHFLFKTLYKYNEDVCIASVYNLPNIARKFLETFLMFRVPNNKTLFDKLQEIQTHTNFDENKIASIYKFVNDQSHMTGRGFDPSLVQETQKTIAYLFEFIQAAFKEHYDILKSSIS